MPTRTLRQRARKGKREGTPVAIREADLGRPTAMSGHAAKKSRAVRAQAGFTDRHVSRRKAPAEGKASRKQADYPRPAGEPPPRTRARRRMAGTDLPLPRRPARQGPRIGI